MVSRTLLSFLFSDQFCGNPAIIHQQFPWKILSHSPQGKSQQAFISCDFVRLPVQGKKNGKNAYSKLSVQKTLKDNSSPKHSEKTIWEQKHVTKSFETSNKTVDSVEPVVFRRHLRGIGHVEMHRSLDEFLGLEADRGADLAHPTVI